MATRQALILPGVEYGPQGPLLMYAAEAVKRRGGSTSTVTWGDTSSVHVDQAGRWVVDQVRPAFASAGQAGVVMIGKSLGSYGAPVAADHGLPAIWLTPLLHRTWVTDALRRATAPFLLIGGSADPSWDYAVATELSPHVLEIPRADHGLFVPGPLAASAAALGEVATAIEDFLDTLWS